LDLFEEAADPTEVVGALVDPPPRRLRQLPIRPGDVDLAALGRPEERLLVRRARRVPPGLHRALGERAGGIGHDASLVVAQEVPEPLALGARAHRMVEGEEERLRPLERTPAGRAAEAVAVAVDTRRARRLARPAKLPLRGEDLDDRASAALAEGLLERLAEPPAPVRP